MSFRDVFTSKFASGFRVGAEGARTISELADVSKIEIVIYNFDRVMKLIRSSYNKAHSRNKRDQKSPRKKKKVIRPYTIEDAIRNGLVRLAYEQPEGMMIITGFETGADCLFFQTEFALSNEEFLPLSMTVRKASVEEVGRTYVPAIDEAQLVGRRIEYRDLTEDGDDQYTIPTHNLDDPKIRGKLLWLMISVLAEKAGAQIWPLVFGQVPAAVAAV